MKDQPEFFKEQCYVALSRARNKLLIIDVDGEFSVLKEDYSKFDRGKYDRFVKTEGIIEWPI